MVCRRIKQSGEFQYVLLALATAVFTRKILTNVLARLSCIPATTAWTVYDASVMCASVHNRHTSHAGSTNNDWLAISNFIASNCMAHSTNPSFNAYFSGNPIITLLVCTVRIFCPVSKHLLQSRIQAFKLHLVNRRNSRTLRQWVVMLRVYVIQNIWIHNSVASKHLIRGGKAQDFSPNFTGGLWGKRLSKRSWS